MASLVVTLAAPLPRPDHTLARELILKGLKQCNEARK